MGRVFQSIAHTFLRYPLSVGLELETDDAEIGRGSGPLRVMSYKGSNRSQCEPWRLYWGAMVGRQLGEQLPLYWWWLCRGSTANWLFEFYQARM